MNQGSWLDFGCFLQVCGDIGSDQVLCGHDFGDGPAQVALETQVPVGDNAYQAALFIDDGNATNFKSFHQFQYISYQFVLRNGDRIEDHPVLGSFHDVHLFSLLFNGHVLVNHPNAAFPGDGDGQFGFGDGIHCCRNNGSIEFDIA